MSNWSQSKDLKVIFLLLIFSGLLILLVVVKTIVCFYLPFFFVLSCVHLLFFLSLPLPCICVRKWIFYQPVTSNKLHRINQEVFLFESLLTISVPFFQFLRCGCLYYFVYRYQSVYLGVFIFPTKNLKVASTVFPTLFRSILQAWCSLSRQLSVLGSHFFSSQRILRLPSSVCLVFYLKSVLVRSALRLKLRRFQYLFLCSVQLFSVSTECCESINIFVPFISFCGRMIL